MLVVSLFSNSPQCRPEPEELGPVSPSAGRLLAKARTQPRSAPPLEPRRPVREVDRLAELLRTLVRDKPTSPAA